MNAHERTQLETKLKELRGTLASLADGAGFEQFIRTIHKPGFATVEVDPDRETAGAAS